MKIIVDFPWHVKGRGALTGSSKHATTRKLQTEGVTQDVRLQDPLMSLARLRAAEELRRGAVSRRFGPEAPTFEP